jgi:hypothetical protein
MVTGDERDQTLMGYLAADNLPHNPQLDSAPQLNWLQCGMSVIAIAATITLRRFPPWNAAPEPLRKVAAAGGQ